jgi:hypothetical protein
MADSSGLGVGAVVSAVHGGGSVGKIMKGGMDGVGMGPDGVVDGLQEVVMMTTMMMVSGKLALSIIEG